MTSAARATSAATPRTGGVADAAVLLAANLAYHVVRVGLSVWAAASLGPERFGPWNVLGAVVAYAPVAHLGVQNAVARDVPIALGRGDHEEARRLEGVGLAAVLAACAVTSLGWLASLAFPAMRAWVPPAVVVAAAGLTAMQLLFVHVQFRARSRLQFRMQALQLMVAAAVMALAYAGVGAGRGLEGLVAALAVGHAAATALAFAIEPARPRLSGLDRRRLGRLVATGFPILSAGILFALLTTVDRWVILDRLGTLAVGHYTLPVLVFGAFSLIPSTISQIAYPRMAHAFGRDGDVAALARLAARQGGTATAAALAAVIALGPALRPACAHWLPEYLPGVTAALLLLGGVVATGAATGAANFLNTTGRHVRYLSVQAAAVALNAGLSLLATELGFGLEGVALASTLTLAAYAAVLAVMTARIARRAARAQARPPGLR